MKKKMRSLLSAALCLSLMLSLCSCGSTKTTDSADASPATESSKTELSDSSDPSTAGLGMTLTEFYNALNQALEDYNIHYEASADSEDSETTMALTLEASDGLVQLPVYLNGYYLSEDDENISIVTLVFPYDYWIAYAESATADDEEDTGTDETDNVIDDVSETNLPFYSYYYYCQTLAAIRVVLGSADAIDIEEANQITWGVVVSTESGSYTEGDLCYAYYYDGDDAESSNPGMIIATSETMEQIN
ncbi:MAG: hypothetical protein LUI87_07255 [Lachnospiraceae bacterium]|nr:hypothetical protein [Lachnospiraceae bacterium]